MIGRSPRGDAFPPSMQNPRPTAPLFSCTSCSAANADKSTAEPEPVLPEDDVLEERTEVSVVRADEPEEPDVESAPVRYFLHRSIGSAAAVVAVVAGVTVAAEDDDDNDDDDDDNDEYPPRFVTAGAASSVLSSVRELNLDVVVVVVTFVVVLEFRSLSLARECSRGGEVLVFAVSLFSSTGDFTREVSVTDDNSIEFRFSGFDFSVVLELSVVSDLEILVYDETVSLTYDVESFVLWESFGCLDVDFMELYSSWMTVGLSFVFSSGISGKTGNKGFRIMLVGLPVVSQVDNE